MQELNWENFSKRYGIDGDRFFDVVHQLPALSHEGPWIGGGCIRRLVNGEDPFASDIDFFYKGSDQGNALKEGLEKLGFTPVTSASTAMAQTFKGKVTISKDSGVEGQPAVEEAVELVVQLISFRHYENIEALVDSFDFSICQFVYDGEKFFTGDFSLYDLAKKRLVPNKITYAAASIRRILKYSKQGFYACQGCIAEILEQVVQNPKIIQADIKYID